MDTDLHQIIRSKQKLSDEHHRPGYSLWETGGGCQRGNTWPLDDRPIWKRPVHKKHDNSKQQGRFKQEGATACGQASKMGVGKQTLPKGTQCGPNSPKVFTSFCHCELSSVPLRPLSSHRRNWVCFPPAFSCRIALFKPAPPGRKSCLHPLLYMTHFFVCPGPEGMGGKGAWLGPANSTSSTRCCGPSSSSTPQRSCTAISSRVRPVAGPWGGGSKFHHPRVSSESQNRGPPPGCNVVTFSGNPSEGRGILRRLGGACCYFPSTLFRREPASQRQLRPADLRFWTGPRCAAFFFPESGIPSID